MRSKSIWLRIILFVLLLTANRQLQSQIKAYENDLDSIRMFILSNPGLLDSLNERALCPDSVLQVSDYFLLYYGSAYLDNYAPYSESIPLDAAFGDMDAERYSAALELFQSVALDHPGFIRPFQLMGMACHMMGDTVTASKWFQRYYEYLSIPFYSGTGLSADSAFIVRCVSDEYLIVSEMGLASYSQSLVMENDLPFDILDVQDEGGGEEWKLYFNVAQPYLLGMSRMFKEDPPSEIEKKKTKSERTRKERKKKR